MQELLSRVEMLADDPLTRNWVNTALDVLVVFKRKHHDYGPDNIGDLGGVGVFVRMYDKMKRLRRLVWEGRQPQVLDETVDKTIVDMADYGIIWLLLRRGLWPGAGREEIGMSEEGIV